jgi:hypothetical protein
MRGPANTPEIEMIVRLVRSMAEYYILPVLEPAATENILSIELAPQFSVQRRGHGQSRNHEICDEIGFHPRFRHNHV